MGGEGGTEGKKEELVCCLQGVAKNMCKRGDAIHKKTGAEESRCPRGEAGGSSFCLFNGIALSNYIFKPNYIVPTKYQVCIKKQKVAFPIIATKRPHKHNLCLMYEMHCMFLKIKLIIIDIKTHG